MASALRKLLFHRHGLPIIAVALFCCTLFVSQAEAQEPNLDLDRQIEAAKALIDNRQYQEAIARLGEILNSDRKNTQAWYWRGRAYHAAGDTATAAKCYQRALGLNPNFIEAKTYLAKIANLPRLEALYLSAEQAAQAENWRDAREIYQALFDTEADFKDVSAKLNLATAKIAAQERKAAENIRETPGPVIRPRPSLPQTFDTAAKKIDSLRILKSEPIASKDSRSALNNKTPIKTPRQNFSIAILAILGVVIIGAIIIFLFRQKRREQSLNVALREPAVEVLPAAIPTNKTEKDIRTNQASLKAAEIPPPGLERYRFEEELGRGGMGRVYKAYDLKLERAVALKLIRLDNTNDRHEAEERIMRFRREAKAIARLNHPNIVSLYDYDETDGMLYMVMEYVEGQSVEQILNAKRQPGARAAVRMIKQACWALDYAHKNGVIHRDLKPSNIMLNVEEVVKVVDFGVAKLLGTSNSQMHTLTGMRLGSPFYMSPEQIEARELDPRSDIFSLGAVFYEMLAGQKPFTLDEGNSLNSLFYAILHTDPQKLKTVPPHLEMIVRKMLAKDRGQRFAKAREIIEALSALQSAA